MACATRNQVSDVDPSRLCYSLSIQMEAKYTSVWSSALKDVVLPFSLLLLVLWRPWFFQQPKRLGRSDILSFALLSFFRYLLVKHGKPSWKRTPAPFEPRFWHYLYHHCLHFFASPRLVIYFLYFVVALSIGGLILAAIASGGRPTIASWLQNDFAPSCRSRSYPKRCSFVLEKRSFLRR